MPYEANYVQTYRIEVCVFTVLARNLNLTTKYTFVSEKERRGKWNVIKFIPGYKLGISYFWNMICLSFPLLAFYLVQGYKSRLLFLVWHGCVSRDKEAKKQKWANFVCVMLCCTE